MGISIIHCVWLVMESIEFALEVLHHPERFYDTDVQAWMAVKENRELYEELRVFLEAGMTASQVESPDAEREFEVLRTKLERKRRGRILRFTTYAASVIFALLFVRVILIPSEDNMDAPAVHQTAEVITPGKNQAILITGNGEQVVLGGEAQNGVEVEEGVSIQYDSIGGVKYHLTGVSAPTYHTLKVPLGGEYKLVLSDGSTVWLNSDSELRYPTVFSKDCRRVYLTGEAFFVVSPNKSVPFIVESRGVCTRVYGTEFNVRSYSDEVLDVTLVKGSVSVTPRKGEKEYRIKPGENAHLTGAAVSIGSVNVQKYTAWKDGYFYYENESLEVIMSDLKRWYDFDVIYTEDSLKELRFELWSEKNQSIESITSLLMFTNAVHVQVSGRTIILQRAR